MRDALRPAEELDIQIQRATMWDASPSPHGADSAFRAPSLRPEPDSRIFPAFNAVSAHSGAPSGQHDLNPACLARCAPLRSPTTHDRTGPSVSGPSTGKLGLTLFCGELPPGTGARG